MVVQASGTQAATIGTEHTLNAAAFTTPGVYILQVDTRNMVNGDTLELRACVKTLSGDTQGYLCALGSYAHKQGDGAAPGAGAGGEVVKFSQPIPSAHSITFTLLQPAGTGRNFPWAVLTV